METYIPSIQQQREQVVNLPGAPKIRQGASEHEIKYMQEMHAIMVTNARMGVEPATIINLSPRVLQVEHPLFRGLIVPACPIDKPYTMLVIRDVRFQARDNEGTITPVDFKPVILAKEFEDQARSYGGVVVFRGDAEEIAKETDGDLFANPLFKKLYNEAKAKLIVFCREKKREADNEWNTPARAGARNITDLHRNCARILLREGLLTKIPDWMDTTRDEAQIANDCPNCGSEPKKGAAMCAVCGYVLDPLKAWQNGTIMDPQHQALARLSRKTLNSIGITREHQPITIEERDAALKSQGRRRGNQQPQPVQEPQEPAEPQEEDEDKE